MNNIKAVCCRIYQQAFRCVAACIKFREPQLYSGTDAISNIPDILEKYRRFHPLVVTDQGLKKLNLDKKITDILKKEKISYSLYFDVAANPTFSMVEAGYKMYREENCDCLIALGGGSSLDAAKAIAIRAVKPRDPLNRSKGVLKVRKKLPLMIAIPTTAGTGSEATAACVVVNDKTKDKFSINDPVVIPHFAILDDQFLANLPQKVISTTGMDALTHAIESYIGTSPLKHNRESALQACALIKNNLFEFYSDPTALAPRANMLKASYLAGVSFTRGYVGYVHALAHSLGGKYNVPHGLANSILLPYVLEAYGKHAHKRLAEIADYLGFSNANQTRAEKANLIIRWVKDLNKKMSIPVKFEDLVKDEDFLELSTHAAKEANPLYPVPVELDAEELETILLLACK